jgi:hypothetical protein
MKLEQSPPSTRSPLPNDAGHSQVRSQVTGQIFPFFLFNLSQILFCLLTFRVLSQAQSRGVPSFFGFRILSAGSSLHKDELPIVEARVEGTKRRQIKTVFIATLNMDRSQEILEVGIADVNKMKALKAQKEEIRLYVGTFVEYSLFKL